MVEVEVDDYNPIFTQAFEKLSVHLEQYGLDKEGVFRITGDTLRIAELYTKLSLGIIISCLQKTNRISKY